jgi:hypothetical protein
MLSKNFSGRPRKMLAKTEKSATMSSSVVVELAVVQAFGRRVGAIRFAALNAEPIFSAGSALPWAFVRSSATLGVSCFSLCASGGSIR